MAEPTRSTYLALPPAGKGPGVLVLHAWWGLNDFMRGFCDRLAQEGFVALAPDMFSGRVARTVPEAEALVAQVPERQAVPSKTLSALDELSQHPAVAPGGVATIGFSYGGYWAFWLATQRPQAIRAVTVFYGSGEGDFAKSQAAFLGHFAEADPYESQDGIRGLESALKGAGRPTTFHTYPGTGHWFFESDRPDAYNAPAAQLAWDRTLAFLRA